MKQLTTQQKMDELIKTLSEEGKVPTLFLHSCCAPCSSYVLEYLSDYFKIIDFYYNPNISPLSEYEERREELKRLISEQKHKYAVDFVEGKYDPENFFAMAKGLENVPEGGERCRKCFEMRLRETAKLAKEYDTDYFATTLTISPLKNAQVLNEVGQQVREEIIGSDEVNGPKYLPSDFKKKNGYKRSTELSVEFGLYRQDFCGCPYSKAARHSNMDSDKA